MTDQRSKKRALGRGLDALLPAAPRRTGVRKRYGDKSVFSCALEKLVPQKGQPRQHFDATARSTSSPRSIREHGLIEPIVVRRVAPGVDRFEIIAGERRWRACQKAGLREALVVVKDVSPKNAFELALIENVQREDLNPVELAEALDRLVKEHGYTQDALAERLGKDRTTITNTLRLHKLPQPVRSKIACGELSEGHARALLGAGEDAAIEQLAEKVIRGQLSVRATEALVRSGANEEARQERTARRALPAARARRIRDLEAAPHARPRDEGRGARRGEQGGDRDPVRGPRRARPAPRQALAAIFCGTPARSYNGRVAIAGCRAAFSVFWRRQAIVIGPTPPGTGVMARARSCTSSNATSPTRRVLGFPLGSTPASSRLIPTSMTTAPGFTQSPH